MADATPLLALQGPSAAHAADLYAQRILPESPALLALFHGRAAPRAEPHNLRRKSPTTSCLRKMSAYNGGFRVSDEDGDASRGDTPSDRPMGGARSRYAKKRLSFADQHGGQLVLEREFHARDAPIYCNKAITYSPPSTAELYDPAENYGWRASSGSVVQRLLRGALQGGGRGGEEKKSGWSQPELLSLCVLSCSVVGCVVLGYARHAQTK